MRIAMVAVATVFALTGCGGGDAPGAHMRTIEFDVHYSTYSTAAIDVHPGETVRFRIRNRDPIAHELIVGDQVVQDYHEHGTEAHHAGRPGEVSIAPGATAETVYTFISRGTLLFGCHLPGHWAYGMKGTIQVA
jgi:uncharacterized cupredoxin-like copper-binding protein